MVKQKFQRRIWLQLNDRWDFGLPPSGDGHGCGGGNWSSGLILQG